MAGEVGQCVAEEAESLLKTRMEEKAEDGLSLVYSASSMERRDRNLGHHEKVADGM